MATVRVLTATIDKNNPYGHHSFQVPLLEDFGEEFNEETTRDQLK